MQRLHSPLIHLLLKVLRLLLLSLMSKDGTSSFTAPSKKMPAQIQTNGKLLSKKPAEDAMFQKLAQSSQISLKKSKQFSATAEVSNQLHPLMTAQLSHSGDVIQDLHNCLAMRMKTNCPCCPNKGQFPIGMQAIKHTCAACVSAKPAVELSTIPQ